MQHLVDHGDGNAQLAQTNRMESLGELASGIAHEINTPAQYVGDNIRFLQGEFTHLLRLIEQYRTLLTSPSLGVEEQKRQIEAMEKEVDFEFLRAEIPQAISQSLEGLERVTTIVRAMKDFSHPGSSVIEPGDLPKLIRSTVEICRNRWKYVAELNTFFESGLPLVPCLLSELNQVILNLIVNAADAVAEKYGSDGTNRGTISISLKRAQDHVELRVSDDGAGIPQAVRSRLFEPFFTTKPVGKGTGQGLSLCRNVIVNRHGGTIDVESSEGVGTTFIIRLPLGEITQDPSGSELL